MKRDEERERVKTWESFAFWFVCFLEVIAGGSCETSPRVRYRDRDSQSNKRGGGVLWKREKKLNTNTNFYQDEYVRLLGYLFSFYF